MVSAEEIESNYLKPGHPTAFGSPNTVSKYYNISLKEAKFILQKIDAYTLHRGFKKPLRNPYFLHYKREQVQVDLIDIRELAVDNDGITFLLVVIDCYTRFLWVQPLLNKKAVSVLAAMKIIFREMITKPETLMCDRGTELKNKLFRAFLTKEKVKLWHPYSEIKCGTVERVNRSLQDLLYKYMTNVQSYRYKESLQAIVTTYNTRPHRTLKKLTPEQAEKPEYAEEVRIAIEAGYDKIREKRSSPKLKISDLVRIKKTSGVFARGYHEGWKREVFEIESINEKMPIPMYLIKVHGKLPVEVIKGGFYSNELVKVRMIEWNIEKVLERKNVNGVEMILVKWQGYDDVDNSWIKASDVTRNYQ